MQVCSLAQTLAAYQQPVQSDVEVVSTVAEPHEEAVAVAVMTLALKFFNDHVVDWSEGEANQGQERLADWNPHLY